MMAAASGPGAIFSVFALDAVELREVDSLPQPSNARGSTMIAIIKRSNRGKDQGGDGIRPMEFSIICLIRFIRDPFCTYFSLATFLPSAALANAAVFIRIGKRIKSPP